MRNKIGEKPIEQNGADTEDRADKYVAADEWIPKASGQQAVP